jgi:hypothetical protein
MSKLCKSCGEEIHPGRLKALPTATTCVECSTTGRKAGVTVTLGEGDHTYNEIIIMEHDDFVKYKEVEAAFRNKGVVVPVTDVFNLDDESDVDHTPEVDIVEDNEDLIVLDELEIEPEDLIDEEENA